MNNGAQGPDLCDNPVLMGQRGEKIQATPSKLRGPPLFCLAALVTLTALVLSDGGSDAIASAGHALLTSAPLTALWMLSALGLGVGAGRALDLRGTAPRVALGACLLMVLEQWCGTLGVFQAGISAALALLAPGWWMSARFRPDAEAPSSPLWAWTAGGVACGTMAAAALVPAGYLWSTEFGAYDALSYHLEAPRAWLACGAIRPLPHLAYAGLPSFVEGAFMHLMALRSDPRQAALACQLLHAAMAVTAAMTLRDAVRRASAEPLVGDLAAVAMLATPWVTVTGSLAYSESGVMLGLALAMVAALQTRVWSGGLIFGLAAATTVGAKASSLLLAVPGAVAWAMLMSRPSRRPIWWALALVSACVALLPWMLRNALLTANPVFPLLCSWMGNGWWSAEQATRFMSAHRSDASLWERCVALWHQGATFGLGANPIPGEPWRFLWGPLPWLGIASLLAAPATGADRRLIGSLGAMTALTCVAWMAATHLQSRFLLPMVLPLAAATGCTLWALSRRPSLWRAVALASLGWSLLPAHALLTDRPGSLALAGRVDLPTGELDAALLRDGDDDSARQVRDAPSTEAALATLFPGARVLAVGWSAPFWLTAASPLRWSTVWDTNPMEEAMRQPDPGAWLAERFDLLLLDEPMLQRWKDSGWLSPGLDVERLRRLTQGRDAMMLSGGRRVVSLQGALHPAWPERPERLPSPSAY